jgi:TfoX/Sxy family transcriptional regulator of competence genes
MRGYYELPSEVLERPEQAVRWAQRALEVARAAAAKKAKKQRKKPEKAAVEVPLARLKNLGPKSAAWLAEVGLRTRGDLERVGSVGAFCAVRAQRGTASRNLLYALEAALLDVHWTELPPPLRERLCQAAEGPAS